jgi:zinc transport system substrate-binding protein
MKKFLPIILVLTLVLAACSPTSRGNTNQTEENNHLNISVSIASVQWLVDQIGGELVKTHSLTSSGDDPHTYEPSPNQMTAMAESDLYLTVGVEFENAWIPKFVDANKNLTVVDIDEGIERIILGDHDHSTENHEHEGLDPHIWLSPERMKQIANKITATLNQFDPENASIYQANLEKTLTIIDEVDRKLDALLADPIRKEFLIVHPSLGYLADSYGLEMISIEIGGQEPSPAQLAEILHLSEEFGIHTLFNQLGTSPVNAQTLANQAGISQIFEIDPMRYDWQANMLQIGEFLQIALN